MNKFLLIVFNRQCFKAVPLSQLSSFCERKQKNSTKQYKKQQQQQKKNNNNDKNKIGIGQKLGARKCAFLPPGFARTDFSVVTFYFVALDLPTFCSSEKNILITSGYDYLINSSGYAKSLATQCVCRYFYSFPVFTLFFLFFFSDAWRRRRRRRQQPSKRDVGAETESPDEQEIQADADKKSYAAPLDEKLGDEHEENYLLAKRAI